MKEKTIRELHHTYPETKRGRIPLSVLIFTIILMAIAIYSCFAADTNASLSGKAGAAPRHYTYPPVRTTDVR
jgi:hypothetical protein